MNLKNIITFTVFLLAISAIGLLLFPSKMLAVVGIVSNYQTDFLLRVSGVGVAALIPGAWASRTSVVSPLSRAVLMGLVIYSKVVFWHKTAKCQARAKACCLANK